jgi:hypothetical protein
MVDLEDAQGTESLRTAIAKSVKTSAEDDILIDPSLGTLEQAVFGIARPRHHGHPEHRKHL